MTNEDYRHARQCSLTTLAAFLVIVHACCALESVAQIESGLENSESGGNREHTDEQFPLIQTTEEEAINCIDAMRENFVGVNSLKIESRTTCVGDFDSFKSGEAYRRVFLVRMSPLAIHEHTVAETDTAYDYTCLTRPTWQTKVLNTQEGKTSKTDASAVALPPIHLGLPSIDALRIWESSDSSNGGVTHGSTVKLKCLLFGETKELPQFAIENVSGRTIVAMARGLTDEEHGVHPLVLARYIPTSYFGYEVGERVRDWRLYGDEQVLLPSYFVTWIRQPGDKHPRIVAATEVLSVEINGELDQSVFED